MPAPDDRSRFTTGLRAALAGLRAGSRSAELRRTYAQMVGALLCMAVALDIAGIWAVLHWTPIDGDTGWWAAIGWWIARLVGIVIVLMLAPLVSLTVVNLLFPFLGERVFIAAMRVRSPARAEELAAQPGLAMGPSVIIALRRLSSLLAMSALTVLVSMIPVVGALLGPAAQGYLSARGLAWELLDPYLDKLRLGYREQRQFVAAHRGALVGFGAPMVLLMAVPVVGPLLFGLAQGAAATLVLDVLEPPRPAA